MATLHTRHIPSHTPFFERSVPTGQLLLSLSLLIVLLLLPVPARSQQLPHLPYRVDFNSGMPEGWVSEVHDSLVWIVDDTMGPDGSGALVFDLGDNSFRDTLSITTPFISIGEEISLPRITFSFALIKNNFVPPHITLWCDTGSGLFRLMGWGETWGITEPIVEVETGQNFGVVLDRHNIVWVNGLLDLPQLRTADSVRFEIRAELMNGGWVLVDDVAVVDNTVGSTAEREDREMHSLVIYPNPASGSVTVRPHDEGADQIELINMNGVRVESISIGNRETISLQTSHLPDGIYFVRLVDRNGVVRERGRFVERHEAGE